MPARFQRASLLGILLAIAGFGVPTASLAQPSVSATLDDGVPAADYRQNNDTLNYTTVITNSGAGNATGVTLTNPTPADTTLVAGSVHASPLANHDSYNAVGNTRLFVGVGRPAGEAGLVVSGSLFDNDVTITDSTVFVSNTNPANGTVSVNGASGTFIYAPNAGFTGADSFTYTLRNSADPSLTDTGTVNITVSNLVWYVDNSYGGGAGASIGTSNRPFTTLANLNGADGAGDSDGANAFIYVYRGTGAAYPGGLPLESGQTLTSESNDLVVGGNFLRAAQSAPNIPTLSHTAASTVALATGNTIDGFSITNSAGNGISGSAIGTTAIADINVSVSNGTALLATTGGTLTVTGSTNTLSTTTGTALNVANVNIGGSGLTFQSISVNSGSNGIVLNNTGATAGLTVTGDGNASVGGNNSGGTIQNTTGHGISLTSTRNVSFTNLNIQTTGGHGINGAGVTNFTFANGKINNAGNASGENSINFDPDSGTANVTFLSNVSGVVSITNNQITNTEADGVRIVNGFGTISNLAITGNQLSDTGDVATPGTAVFVRANAASAGSFASVTRADLNNNTITDFRAGAGFLVQAVSTDATNVAPVSLGTPGSATNIINVTGNLMNGGNGGIGNQPDRFITAGIAGTAAANFNVSSNGTAANPITNIDCIAIELQADGHSTYNATVNNNRIVANSAVGCAGIAIGADADGFAGTTDDAFMTATVSGNNISQTDGPGIFTLARGVSTARLNAHILNNIVAAPSATNSARAGIRVDSGSAGSDTIVNLEISGNTTAGSTNTATSTTSPGINLRKQGTDPAINEFHIQGLSPSRQAPRTLRTTSTA